MTVTQLPDKRHQDCHHRQKPEEAEFYPEPGRERGPAGTLTLDFWSLELWESEAVLSYGPQSGVLLMAAPGNWTWGPGQEREGAGGSEGQPCTGGKGKRNHNDMGKR